VLRKESRVSGPAANPYDQVVYGSVAHAQTHPNRLATVASLYGLTPAPVQRCRVLELGCATGDNLIPMAYGLPGSAFVGVDYSARQVERGQAQVAELGLKNIEIRHGDIRDLGPDLGAFDYIIAHGVYSWVPADVQERVLRICGRHLTPRGVAFISFTAGPGGELRRILREMMLHHVEHGQSATAGRVARGREMAALLKQVPLPNPLAVIFANPLERILKQEEASLFHDQLNEFFDVVTIQEFMNAAAPHGLQYLGDADPDENASHTQPPEVGQTALQWAGADRVARQQYLDILRFRQFRQTLLCRRECVLDDPPPAERLQALHFLLARLRLRDGVWQDVRSSALVQFETESGMVAVADPLTKAILRVLETNAPHAQTFSQLLEGCRSLLAEPGQPPLAAAALAAALLEAWFTALVEAHTHVPPIVPPGERPTASPIIRSQVRRELLQVTNLRHVLIAVADPMARALLLLLDGTRDRPALVEALAAGVESGGIPTPPGKEWPREPPALRAQLARDLETSLRALSSMAMLVG